MMKTTNIVGAVALAGLAGLATTFASTTYPTKEAFMQAEGNTCKMATDGVNSFFGKDFSASTMIGYPENFVAEWSCEDEKTNTQNRYIVVLKKGTDQNSVISAVQKLANVEYGKIIFDTDDLVMFTVQTTDKTAITKIENITGVNYVEPDQEVSIDNPVEEARVCTMQYEPVCGVDRKTYSNKCSAGNTKIAYEGKCKNILSDNDANRLAHLTKTLDQNLKAKVDSALTKYEKKLKKLNNPQKINNKVVEKVETAISQFLLKYPQDTALPAKASSVYDALSYLKLRLMDIDCDKKKTAENQHSQTKTLEVIGVFGEMDGDSVELIGFDKNGKYDFAQKYSTIFSIPNLGDNYISVKQGDRLTITGEFSKNRIFSITQLTPIKNPKKEECEAQKNRKWKPQGKAQIPTCITEYTDGGKTCTSSSQCQGNCVKTDANKPAMCEAHSSQFGCKTTIENFEKGEGILCMD